MAVHGRRMAQQTPSHLVTTEILPPKQHPMQLSIIFLHKPTEKKMQICLPPFDRKSGSKYYKLYSIMPVLRFCFLKKKFSLLRFFFLCHRRLSFNIIF